MSNQFTSPRSPVRGLLAGILLAVVVAVAWTGGSHEQAAAQTLYPPPFNPSSVVATGSCHDAAIDFCDGNGNVVYTFIPSNIPANATSIQWKVSFEGSSQTGSGGINVYVDREPGVLFDSYPVQVGVGPFEVTYHVGPDEFDHTWDPTTPVKVKIEKEYGDQVQFKNVRASMSFIVPDPADLSVDVQAPAEASSGSSFDYNVTVKNKGTGQAQGVVLNTTIDSQVVSLFADGCNGQAGAIPTCNLGTINAGSAKTVVIHAFTALNASGDKAVTSSVTASSPDPVGTNNSDTAHTVVALHRSVMLCKTWENNGNGAPDAAVAFQFVVDWPGKSSPTTYTRTVAEGATVCGPISVKADATVTVTEISLQNWDDSAAYPQYQFAGQAAHTIGADATFGPSTNSLTFFNKRLVARPANDPGVGPTATPTSTATPKATATATVTATPTATTPPSGTVTATPEANPTETPEGPAGDPNSGGVDPGTGDDSPAGDPDPGTGDVPSDGAGDDGSGGVASGATSDGTGSSGTDSSEGTGTGDHVDAPHADEGASGGTPASSPTPLAPAAGSGQRQSSNTGTWLLIVGSLVMLVATATFASKRR